MNSQDWEPCRKHSFALPIATRSITYLIFDVTQLLLQLKNTLFTTRCMMIMFGWRGLETPCSTGMLQVLNHLFLKKAFKFIPSTCKSIFLT